jgi:hypothetical protein
MSGYPSLRESSILFTSDILAIGTEEIEVDKSKLYGHHFVGVEFFSDSSGTPATPSSGTYSITVETWELPGVFQSPLSNLVTAATPVSVNFSGAPTKIKFDPDTIVGATHFRLIVNSNRT